MMKKYITPAAEITSVRSEGMIATSFNVDPEVTIKGDGTDVGQLTNQYGWDSNDWSD